MKAMEPVYYFANFRDRDYPLGNNFDTFVFSENENYIEEGNTHGLLSHCIKHFNEFNPSFVNEKIQQIRNIIKNCKNLYILNKSNNVIFQMTDSQTCIQTEMIYNTMDFINDKLMNDIPLMPDEQEIRLIISSLSEKYLHLLKSYILSSIPAETIEDVATAISLGKIIQFEGRSFGYTYVYYINFSNSALIVQWKDKPPRNGFTVRMISTFFRIDKNGNDLKKIANHFDNVEIFNENIRDYFENT